MFPSHDPGGETGGQYTFLTSACILNIHSSASSDALTSVGLRTMKIQGLDQTFTAVEEIVSLSGPIRVQTSNKYLRTNFMTGLTAGVSATNVGVITAQTATGSVIQSQMNANEGMSQNGVYTVPLNHTLFVTRVEFNIGKDGGGGSPEVEFKAFARSGAFEPNGVFLQLFDKKLDETTANELDVDVPFSRAIVA